MPPLQHYTEAFMTLSAITGYLAANTPTQPASVPTKRAAVAGFATHTDTFVQQLSSIGPHDVPGMKLPRETGSGLPARRPARSAPHAQPIEAAPQPGGSWTKSIAEWLGRIDLRSDVAVLGELLINGRDDKELPQPPQDR
jgi:hypothetical protein